jgi:hypothetical protein
VDDTTIDVASIIDASIGMTINGTTKIVEVTNPFTDTVSIAGVGGDLVSAAFLDDILSV